MSVRPMACMCLIICQGRFIEPQIFLNSSLGNLINFLVNLSFKNANLVYLQVFSIFQYFMCFVLVITFIIVFDRLKGLGIIGSGL